MKFSKILKMSEEKTTFNFTCYQEKNFHFWQTWHHNYCKVCHFWRCFSQIQRETEKIESWKKSEKILPIAPNLHKTLIASFSRYENPPEEKKTRFFIQL